MLTNRRDVLLEPYYAITSNTDTGRWPTHLPKRFGNVPAAHVNTTIHPEHGRVQQMLFLRAFASKMGLDHAKQAGIATLRVNKSGRVEFYYKIPDAITVEMLEADRAFEKRRPLKDGKKRPRKAGPRTRLSARLSVIHAHVSRFIYDFVPDASGYDTQHLYPAYRLWQNMPMDSASCIARLRGETSCAPPLWWPQAHLPRSDAPLVFPAGVRLASRPVPRSLNVNAGTDFDTYDVPKPWDKPAQFTRRDHTYGSAEEVSAQIEELSKLPQHLRD